VSKIERDKPQLGISAQARDDLDYIKKELDLPDRADAYRFGISVALQKELVAADASVSRDNYISTSSLDSDGAIQAAVLELRDDHDGRPYALVERLAEAGAADVATFLRSGRPIREYVQQLGQTAQLSPSSEQTGEAGAIS
jgi:hypothetical protein